MPCTTVTNFYSEGKVMLLLSMVRYQAKVDILYQMLKRSLMGVVLFSLRRRRTV